MYQQFWNRQSSRTSIPPNKLSYGRGFTPTGLATQGIKWEKPVSIPPPKTLGDAKKSAWWEGYKSAIGEEIENLVD